MLQKRIELLAEVHPLSFPAARVIFHTFNPKPKKKRNVDYILFKLHMFAGGAAGDVARGGGGRGLLVRDGAALLPLQRPLPLGGVRAQGIPPSEETVF